MVRITKLWEFFTYILCTIRKVTHIWFLIVQNKTDINQWNKCHSSSATTLPDFFTLRQNKPPSCLGALPASDLGCCFFLYPAKNQLPPSLQGCSLLWNRFLSSINLGSNHPLVSIITFDLDLRKRAIDMW